jgi:hypothetical protein
MCILARIAQILRMQIALLRKKQAGCMMIVGYVEDAPMAGLIKVDGATIALYHGHSKGLIVQKKLSKY